MNALNKKFIAISLLVLTFFLSIIHYSYGYQEEKYFDYQVLAVFPHDPNAFTQGLIFHQGYLYESTGLYGSSSLRQVRLEDGAILKQVHMDKKYFGEGLTLVEDRLIQLTWKEHRGFVYDLETFEKINQFSYTSEGWGITYDGEHLIMSDGSSNLTYLDPLTYRPIKKLIVTSSTGLIDQLNELEFINGIIYANVWYSNQIALIDPLDGRVIGWVDLSNLPELTMEQYAKQVDVLNGIAYDANSGSLFITGKLWPHIYQIQIIQ